MSRISRFVRPLPVPGQCTGAGISSWGAALRSIARSAAAAAVLAVAGLSAAQAATVTLNVVSARTAGDVTQGDAVTTFKYLINADNTGVTTQRPDPVTGNPPVACTPADPGYPGSCLWTSIAGVPGSSPIYTQGSEADFAGGASINVPAGRYLVSVLADGYKLDGKHFTVGATDTALTVTVELQPWPLPDAQIQSAVFEDISPTNGAPDLPAEHGLAGFQGHILDYLGEVTTNVYGDPLCSKYDAGGNLIPGSGGKCLSACYVVDGGVDVGTVAPVDSFGRCPLSPTDAAGNPLPMLEGGLAPTTAAIEGKIKIPNLGPNRYTLSVTPPDGSGWIQTTTLEGNHDWDAWVMEGATGLDTEFVVAGEPFPAIIFGYVLPKADPLGGSGTITGVVDAFKAYVASKGGVLSGEPLVGGRIDKPIENPWISLNDLGNGDTAVWVGQGNANGAFTIPNVPDGTYTLTWWDEPQNYILNIMNVTVAGGETVDLGVLPLDGWWTRIEGYVFNDLNRNGIKDPGEPGLPGYTLTFRKRENSLMDRGATVVTTDADGYYNAEGTYPMTQWLVLEAYDDLHYTTGVTYQADNQSEPTTHLGAGVDVSVLPIIGLGGRIDWGKHVYQPFSGEAVDPMNGGIVGTVSYDTTRNELDPQYAATEDWQPGVSNMTMKLYAPVPCGTTTTTRCDATGRYELAVDGSYAKGPLLNTYVTETWTRPNADCVPRDVNNNPLAYPADQEITNSPTDCLEAPLMGVQFGTYATDQGTPSANFGASVDGNYGFGDGCFGPGGFDEATGACADGSDPASLPAGDYLVEVAIPSDALGRPLYKVTREEDINIGNGDEFVPAVPPAACAGALHTVDVAGQGTDGYGPIVLPNGITVPASTPTDNPTFPGTSVYEGKPRPLCNVKLVNLANGKSVVPIFHLFTDVPIPSRMWGLIVDDLNFSSNPKSTSYGEKAGVPFAPVGVYDWTNRLITTVESDYNGLWDVLLPSSNRINCPTPSGVCANLYRFVGNDPGVPGRLNLNFKPEFRTISAEFEAIPGLIVPADLAPTQVGMTAQLPGGQFGQVMCMVNDPTTAPIKPELFAVLAPYATVSNNSPGSVTIDGQGFGATRGAGNVFLGTAALPIVSWSDTHIVATVPGTTAGGPQQLRITADNGQSTVNGLTFHVIRVTGNSQYNPMLFEVGPGRTYATIQGAIDAATATTGAATRARLVVVYPGTPDLANPRNNPRGAYYENLIITAPIKLQGVGPGGVQQVGGATVPGSIIDGSAFGGDTALADAWRAKLDSLTVADAAGNAVPTWLGNPNVGEGAVITLLALPGSGNTSWYNYGPGALRATIDGFSLRGGDQQGQANLVTQGGAIYANAYIHYLQISNNEIAGNSSSYGTVRIGTPNLAAPDTDQHNDNVLIANNRIIRNAGTNLAGGVALFAGASNYEVARNDICGNFSAEYGGGISHYGLSANSSIHDNRIYNNQSYDEGGGVLIAGALPADPLANYGTANGPQGSGAVNIYNNLVQANMANDDGGGIRFLQAGNFAMNVYNNFIVNNISTHEGGGIALNDAPKVRIYNNTVMKNLTTATAVTSNGLPAPAGLSTSANSGQLQATLPAGSPGFSNPLLFNNIFWDNRAGTRGAGTVTGLGAPGDVTPINYWDLGVADGTGSLAPTNSILQVTTGTVTSGTNVVGMDPLVVTPYDVSVTFQPWRNNPAFVDAIMVTSDLPPNLLGNYHLQAGSPAINGGASSKAVPSYQQPPTTLAAPSTDIDNQSRPFAGGYDIGADEVH